MLSEVRKTIEKQDDQPAHRLLLVYDHLDNVGEGNLSVFFYDKLLKLQIKSEAINHLVLVGGDQPTNIASIIEHLWSILPFKWVSYYREGGGGLSKTSVIKKGLYILF